MSDPREASPFQPGVRVAIDRGIYGYEEGIVEKVYKTGRFVLKGSTQQWRPFQPGYNSHWCAEETGPRGWHSYLARVWDAEADQEIAEKKAAAERRRRLFVVKQAVNNLRPESVSEELVASLEVALARTEAK